MADPTRYLAAKTIAYKLRPIVALSNTVKGIIRKAGKSATEKMTV